MRLCLRSFGTLRSYHPALYFDSDPNLFEVVGEEDAWSEVDKLEKLEEIGLQLRRGFASVEEQAALISELEQGPFKKLRWEEGHWDAVIKHYRETERMQWNDPRCRAGEQRFRSLLFSFFFLIYFGPVVKRMKACFPADWSWRPQHILDLKAEGEIGPHVDAVSTVGDLVCG